MEAAAGVPGHGPDAGADRGAESRCRVEEGG
nr:MAG TPA: hypothetical protein [Caudoviricetes sp.]